MNPEAVSGLQIRNLGDGKSCTGALDAHLYLWSNQVEGSIVSTSGDHKKQEKRYEKKGREDSRAAF
jgi:hypothetical protein